MYIYKIEFCYGRKQLIIKGIFWYYEKDIAIFTNLKYAIINLILTANRLLNMNLK